MALHEQTTVERLCGGSFNRIIGVSIVTFRDNHSEETMISSFILRVPRFLDAKVDADVSILNLVSRYAEIKAPQVVYFDISPNNPLERPFMVQKRIPGVTLQDVYPLLSHEKQCTIARQVGHVFRKLLLCKHDVAGAFEGPSDTALCPHYPGIIASIRPFGMMVDFLYAEQAEKENDAMKALPYPKDPRFLGWTEILRAAFVHRRNVYKSLGYLNGHPSLLNLRYVDAFLDATSTMESLFSCYDNDICLCHLDLAPRNILVDTSSKPTLTGVLDWDNAVFGPVFMTCAPPMWLWAWNEDGDEDERTVNDPLPTVNQQKLKRAFDEAAGPRYNQFAYLPQFRLARQLCQFAMHRLSSTTNIKEADEFLKEIEAMKKNNTVLGLVSSTDSDMA